MSSLSYISSSTIDQSDMDRMLDCTIIDLSGNDIEKIERSFFDNHQKLESLNLDNNRLISFPENVFSGFLNLRKLSVQNNFLEVISCSLFRFNLKLEHIDFSNNKLTRISPNILNSLSELRFASFKGNFCVNSTFPQESLEELKAKISTSCGGKDLLTFIVSLMKISANLKNGKLGLQEVSKFNGNIDQQIKSVTTQIDLTTKTIGLEITSTASSIITKRAKDTSDLDTLIVSLFWLIVPIILILLAIFAAIFFAIYKKYFVYSVNASRRP